MKKAHCRPLFAAATLLFAISSASQAALTLNSTIGIDFGSVASTGAEITFNNYDGDGIAAGANGSTLSSLVDSTNTAVSDVTFFLTNSTIKNSLTGFNAGSTGPSPFNVESVYGDGFIVNSNSGAPPTGGSLSQANSTVLLTFTGLDDSLKYDLTGGFHPANNNPIFNTTWIADSKTATTDASATGTGYISLSGLNTDGAGNLVITLNNSGGNSHVVVGGLTLTAIPEPSSTALLLGGLGLLAFTRRRA